MDLSPAPAGQVAVNDGDDLLESTTKHGRPQHARPVLAAAEGLVRTVRRACPQTATRLCSWDGGEDLRGEVRCEMRCEVWGGKLQGGVLHHR